MLGNPVMVTTPGLTIVLLVLCITYVTRTAPLNISFPELQNHFTKEISDSLKVVKWGCAKGTKCFEQIELLKKIAENHGIKIKPLREKKYGKGKKAKKQAEDDGKRNSAYFKKFAQKWAASTKGL